MKKEKSPLQLALFAIVGNLHFESFRNRNGQERQLQINSRDVLVSIVEEFVKRWKGFCCILTSQARPISDKKFFWPIVGCYNTFLLYKNNLKVYLQGVSLRFRLMKQDDSFQVYFDLFCTWKSFLEAFGEDWNSALA